MCGNFGLLLLSGAHDDKVIAVLKRMLQVTMMRGAQSAGLCTYLGAGEGKSAVGVRSRVVNGKRTDLSDLCLKKFASDLRKHAWRRFAGSAVSSPQLFQGHTRFATSSICNEAGCHPHQWLPPSTQTCWRYVGDAKTGGRYVGESRSVEAFITHNGDLDYVVVHGQR